MSEVLPVRNLFPHDGGACAAPADESEQEYQDGYCGGESQYVQGEVECDTEERTCGDGCSDDNNVLGEQEQAETVRVDTTRLEQSIASA